MVELSPDFYLLVYGLTFFVMGLAVTVRALATPASNLRNRLLALGVFGLLHAVFTWLLFDETVLWSYLRPTLYIVSYLALYYFAFGWRGRRRTTVHVIAAAMTCVLVIAPLLISEPSLMPTIRRLGVSLPVAVCAGLVFVFDDSFRFGSKLSEIARWIAAIGFFVFAALNLFPQPSGAFPASVLNSDTFEAVTSLSTRMVRGGTVIMMAIAILVLIGSLDVTNRQKSVLLSMDAP